jgi:UDP-N-acetylglucosamine 2-epimerase (non-hydrolysing)
MNILLIAGARPNFMKIAPIYRAALPYENIECHIVHTGQHYDYGMSEVFFEDLGIPLPSFHLEAGSGSHATQTARIMTAFEAVCEREKPDLVMVVGDVNSTLACSIVAKKLLCKVAHVEAGLRSFDLTMPEEINRMVTDAISDYFFVTEESGAENLLREGKPQENIHFVGNVMIDNLLYQLSQLNDGVVDFQKFSVYGLKQKLNKFAFMTLHRPSNVDSSETFNGIITAINKISEDIPIIFPVHPRTRKMVDHFGAIFSSRIVLLPPLSYKESLYLWKDADVVFTDSGGLQEETTALGIPCVTIRENTERPITIAVGTNVLAGTTPGGILKGYEESIEKKSRAAIPQKWDGRAAERIWAVLL